MDFNRNFSNFKFESLNVWLKQSPAPSKPVDPETDSHKLADKLFRTSEFYQIHFNKQAEEEEDPSNVSIHDRIHTPKTSMEHLKPILKPSKINTNFNRGPRPETLDEFNKRIDKIFEEAIVEVLGQDQLIRPCLATETNSLLLKESPIPDIINGNLSGEECNTLHSSDGAEAYRVYRYENDNVETSPHSFENDEFNVETAVAEELQPQKYFEPLMAQADLQSSSKSSEGDVISTNISETMKSGSDSDSIPSMEEPISKKPRLFRKKDQSRYEYSGEEDSSLTQSSQCDAKKRHDFLRFHKNEKYKEKNINGTNNEVDNIIKKERKHHFRRYKNKNRYKNKTPKKLDEILSVRDKDPFAPNFDNYQNSDDIYHNVEKYVPSTYMCKDLEKPFVSHGNPYKGVNLGSYPSGRNPYTNSDDSIEGQYNPKVDAYGPVYNDPYYIDINIDIDNPNKRNH